MLRLKNNMKRITKKAWFGKKYIGWGLRPVSPEGWLATLVFLGMVVADVIYFKKSIFGIVVAVALIVIFIVFAILTGDRPGSELWEKSDNKSLIVLVYIVLLMLIILAVYQIQTLRVAHSSFENYYNFRGCVYLIEKTDTDGTCKLSSGQTIKLVKYQDKWYLEGDLPYPGLNFL